MYILYIMYFDLKYALHAGMFRNEQDLNPSLPNAHGPFGGKSRLSLRDSP